MTRTPPLRDERGVALIMVLLLALVVTAIALGSIAVMGNTAITSKFHAREAALQSAADAGLEIARDSLNRVPAMLPANGKLTLASGQPVKDAYGNTIPGFTRDVYVGRAGGRAGGVGTAGQYGNNLATAVSVIRNRRGLVAARRLLLTQESWSKFAIAINNWTNGSISYGCEEGVQGPFFSNHNLVLQAGCSNPKTQFTGTVQVVGSIANQNSGSFAKGVSTGVTPIPWPASADIARMRQYAQDADVPGGDYDITGDPNLDSRAPTVRIEFIPFDVNKNGKIDPDEGYMRIFKATETSPGVVSETRRRYVTARRWWFGPNANNAVTSTNGSGNTIIATGIDSSVTYDSASTSQYHNLWSENCGQVVGDDFVTVRYIWETQGAGANKSAVQADKATRAHDFLWGINNYRPNFTYLGVKYSGAPRCYLGGDPRLFGETIAGQYVDTLIPAGGIANALTANRGTGTFTRATELGRWQKKRTLVPVPALQAVHPVDAVFYIPIQANVNFKGVIYVNGSVAVSGRLRGRVTIAATGNIMIADDITYVTPPGTECNERGDILGLFSQRDVLIQDNNLTTPMRLATSGSATNKWRSTFDDTPDNVNVNAFLLTLRDWAGDNPGWPTFGGESEPLLPDVACGTAPRGCVRVTGGITEAFVRQTTYSPSKAGWAERHAYDICGAIAPPPYWPTTGRYAKNRYFEIDPVWLNNIGVDQLFTILQSQ